MAISYQIYKYKIEQEEKEKNTKHLEMDLIVR